MYKTRIADNATMYPGRGPSKFYGTCKICGENYQRGDAVNWNPRVKGTCSHASCYAVHGSPVGAEYIPTPVIRSEPKVESTPRGFTMEELTATPKVTPVVESGKSSLGETLADAIKPYLEGKLSGLVTKEQVKQIVNDLCKDMVFKSVTTVEVTSYDANGTETRDMGVQHKQFPLLLKVMQARTSDGFRLNIWLSGPAGTGKTTAARKCAEALGLPFFFTGAIDTEYKLMGFVNAQGQCVNTDFKKWFTGGGVFLFDEVDGSFPAALMPFQAALANGICAFPDGIYHRHQDAICVAAANTWGLGGSSDYVGTAKLNAAFLDRFSAKIYWGYDEELELATCPNHDWVRKVQRVRAKAKAKGLKVLITPRASYSGAALLATGLDEVTVTEIVLKATMTVADWESIQ